MENPRVPSSGRTKIGEPNKRGDKRTAFSRRAEKGDLTVLKKTCPNCHHHKIFGTSVGKYKCCKCGEPIKV